MKDREEIVQQKIREKEFVEAIQLEGARLNFWKILTEDKGYSPEDIEVDPEFDLGLPNCESKVSIDFILTISQVSFMAVKCSPSSMESWERYSLAFARSVKEYQIPYAAVTDGENARIFDTLTATCIAESLDSLFRRVEAENIVKNLAKTPCPEKRLEKEKRIVYAFEGIKCPTEKQSPEPR